MAQCAGLEVELPDGRIVPVRVRAHDSRLDLAILVPNGRAALTRLIANRQPGVGEPVIVMGHPLGSEHGRPVQSVRTGIVSSTTRRWLYVDSLTLPGDSGGPVLDARGRLLGIVSGTSRGGLPEAVPVSVVDAWLRRAETHPNGAAFPLNFSVHVAGDLSMEGRDSWLGVRPELLVRFPWFLAELRVGFGERLPRMNVGGAELVGGHRLTAALVIYESFDPDWFIPFSIGIGVALFEDVADRTELRASLDDPSCDLSSEEGCVLHTGGETERTKRLGIRPVAGLRFPIHAGVWLGYELGVEPGAPWVIGNTFSLGVRIRDFEATAGIASTG